MEQKYAGADWVLAAFKSTHPNLTMSPLGRVAADMLGELFYGIYHLDTKMLSRIDWNNDLFICATISWSSLATFDADILTRLVFLAHHLAIRVEIKPASPHSLRIYFHQRKREGGIWERHPTLDEAVATFKRNVSLPERKSEDN